MAVPTSLPASRTAATRAPRRTVPPVLVRQVRSGVVESVHRGDIVEADATGRLLRVIGDPDRVAFLRSTVKPFGLLALLRAGGRREFDLTGEELAILVSSHSGEDVHVRTIQALYRRVGIAQAMLTCGTEGMPLDALTAARLARDGERPSPLRHMCSGQHSVFLLLAKLGGWELETYWQPDHPAHVAYRDAVAAAFGVAPERMTTGIDGCGLLTYAFQLRQIARAYAMLADPGAIPDGDRRSVLAPHLVVVRDAMIAHPELVAGTRERLDTSLMKAAAGRVVSKSGMEALRGIGILPGPRGSAADVPASGMAVKVEDGDGYERGTWAASVEALRQAGVLEGQALRVLARYHRPPSLDPHGRVAAEAVPEFELAPVGELIG
jgi:L-asparaginase II